MPKIELTFPSSTYLVPLFVGLLCFLQKHQPWDGLGRGIWIPSNSGTVLFFVAAEACGEGHERKHQLGNVQVSLMGWNCTTQQCKSIKKTDRSVLGMAIEENNNIGLKTPSLVHMVSRDLCFHAFPIEVVHLWKGWRCYFCYCLNSFERTPKGG